MKKNDQMKLLLILLMIMVVWRIDENVINIIDEEMIINDIDEVMIVLINGMIEDDWNWRWAIINYWRDNDYCVISIIIIIIDWWWRSNIEGNWWWRNNYY